MTDTYCSRWLGRLLLAALGVTGLGSAVAREHADSVNPNQMSITIKNDRLTMMLVKVPQVYLAGPLDRLAPSRFETELHSGRIPDGADIFLDSEQGELASGLALGRLFRQHRLVTHIGARRMLSEHGAPLPAKAAVCTDACAYAYFGGLYRWAPSGTDRIGLHQSQLPDLSPGTAWPAPAAAATVVDSAQPQSLTRPMLAAYLSTMGYTAAQLHGVMRPPEQDMLWLDTEQMLPWLVANNGRLPLSFSYQQAADSAQLVFLQIARDGRHQVTFRCDRSGVTVAAAYDIGYGRAQTLAGRDGGTYFELDHQEIMPHQSMPVQRMGGELRFSRSLSGQQLLTILGSESLGAWVRDRSGSVRYGFTIGPIALKNSTRFFPAVCGRAMAATATASVPAAAASGSAH